MGLAFGRSQTAMNTGVVFDRMNRIAPRRMQRLPFSVLHPVNPVETPLNSVEF